MNKQRLILKHPTGWFAAGREMMAALDQLSDFSFKIFVYLSLNADRHSGKMETGFASLASVLRKKEGAVRAGVHELISLGMVRMLGAEIEINDRYWPYERQEVSRDDSEVEYVRQVRAELLKPACVRSAFIPAEDELAVNLFRRGVHLDLLKRAIWLGCARRYLAMLNGQTRELITSLRYFMPVVEEVSGTQVPEGYWEHVRFRVQQMEERWLKEKQAAQAAS